MSHGERQKFYEQEGYMVYFEISGSGGNVSFGDYFSRPRIPKYRRTEPDFKLNQRLFRADKIRLLITPYWGMIDDKDHIKSDLPVSTDWWNENVNEVYHNGCHIGWLLQATNNRRNSRTLICGEGGFSKPESSKENNNVELVKQWLRIQNNRNRNGDGTLDFGNDVRVVLLNLSGMMIFNRNNELEERALQTGCDFIRSISSKLVEWIEKMMK